MRWSVILLFLAVLLLSLFGFAFVSNFQTEDLGASSLMSAATPDISGYQRAIEPYAWDFPRDFGAHPDFLTEWWYYTGNVEDETGQRFGFQFTIFRRAISPTIEASPSEWRSNQIYLAHFTLSDIEGEQFFHDQRFSRAGADLAGASTDANYHVWLEDWQVRAMDESAARVSLNAQSALFGIDLVLEQSKAPALQGNQGLSQKAAEVGRASYYYSLSRLLTTGTIRIGTETFTVTGNTWKDHEFSTQALGADAQGWDWFGLIFEDGSELMLGRIRTVDGSQNTIYSGAFIYPDGSVEILPSSAFEISSDKTWTSPHTGAVYPSGWQIRLQTVERGEVNLTLTPLLLDQELYASEPVYWEGAVRVTGDLSGYGYAELTGYADSMQNRF